MSNNIILIILGIFLCLSPVLPKKFIYRENRTNRVKDVQGYIKAQIKLLVITGILFIIIGLGGVLIHKSLFIWIIIPIFVNFSGGVILNQKYTK